jgi:RNA polymerase sigma-70 factor (ECF subfamily)
MAVRLRESKRSGYYRMPQHLTDEAWVSQLTSDDPFHRDAAVSELRQLLVRALKRTLTERYGSQLSIEDIVQESLVKILDSIHQFEGRSRFTTWAISIATRVGLTELRKRRYKDVSLDASEGPALVASLSDATESPGADSDRRRILSVLAQKIQEDLTDRQRTAIQATLDELPVEEIASRLGSNRNAIYKLIHDARIRLRDGLLNAGISPDDLTALASH